MDRVTATVTLPYAPEHWETLQSAARRTGYSYNTFKKWRYVGTMPIPVYNHNGSLRVKVDEVNAWMESTRIPPSKPVV